METINKKDISLGILPYDVLGFKSEEELNLEILKLIAVRKEFKNKFKINSI